MAKKKKISKKAVKRGASGRALSARKKARVRKPARGAGGAGGARPPVVGGPPSEPSPLARDLLRLYGELGRLGRAAEDKGDRRRLRERRDAIGVQFDEVMAAVILEDTNEYRAAAAEVRVAIDRAEDAIADLSRVVGAITAVARVVDAVAKVLAAAG